MLNASADIAASPDLVKEHPRAVYALECAYDGPIPAPEMAHARSIDAAWEAVNPTYSHEYPSEIEVCRMTIADYKAHVHRLIKAKRGMNAAGLVNRLWSFSTVLMYLHCWRSERRRLAALIATEGKQLA